MFAQWFSDNIYGSYLMIYSDGFRFTIFPAPLFGLLMFALFLWASFHLITDLIMAFRAVFGFGYKKRKGGSH